MNEVTQEGHRPSESITSKSHPPDSIRPKPTTKKNYQIKPKRKEFIEESKEISAINAFKLPLNDPRHIALTDGEGNLYPTNLGVDDEYVIAYGDLIVGESRYLKEYESGEKTVKVPKPQIWPDAIVPYKVGPKITEDQKLSIKLIANSLRDQNIVELRPYDPKKDKAYVYFKQGSSNCYAQVGYTGGVTQVALNEKCGEKEIFHEIFHVIGFFHEQNRYDRDDFVKILWENIDEKHWPQFEKFSKDSFPEIFQDPKKIPFTYQTLMLYGPSVFSNNGDYSIVDIYGEAYDSNFFPTDEDYRRARLLYGKPANLW